MFNLKKENSLQQRRTASGYECNNFDYGAYSHSQTPNLPAAFSVPLTALTNEDINMTFFKRNISFGPLRKNCQRTDWQFFGRKEEKHGEDNNNKKCPHRKVPKNTVHTSDDVMSTETLYFF
ncbi:hypothetical protein CEXT_40641 [Caerostris extrusa]|uniref:Uncharacterized protein n=1 Tax=Caerostris extrusa TaxID=172846 RepID=A0AAV4S0T0_CAEEX|nr:hypothetical protein CEXT_40641 [Caerostris extrusa]